MGRSARWASIEAVAEISGLPGSGGSATAPEAGKLSERALAAARTADRLGLFFDAHLRSAGRGAKPLGVAGCVLALAGIVLILASGANVLPLGAAWIGHLAVAGLLLGAGAFMGIVRMRERSCHKTALAAAGELSTCRHYAITARRIDTILAGFYGHGEPRSDERTTVNALLTHLECDIADLARRTAVLRGEADAALRRHERIVPRQTRTTVRVEDGRVFSARIVDISLSGVAIETELPDVRVGAAVMIGSHRAGAVRKLQRGMAFEFKDALDDSAFNAAIVL